MDLPDQEELRRRLRAARALRDLSVVDLAKLMPSEAKLSLSTLRKIESGERKLDPIVLRELAAHLQVPYAWFTVPDLAQAVLGEQSESVEDRLHALETAQALVTQQLREMAAERRGGARHTPPAAGRSQGA